jgi:5-methylcytosine-specific restriction enzyme A
MARTHGHGNPNWSRDETILALDLYFRCAGEIPNSDDIRIVELSKELRVLPIHEVDLRNATFRNPDGVAFKLQNLRQVATGQGFANTSVNDRNIWKEFGSQPVIVAHLANSIRAAAKEMEKSPDAPWSSEDDVEFFEGRVLTKLHRIKERAKGLRKKLLAVRRRLGALTCDMCARPCGSTDSQIDDAPFEVHHVVPLSATILRRTRLADVALLCANCHRILHRAIANRKRWIGLPEARTLVKVTRE